MSLALQCSAYGAAPPRQASTVHSQHPPNEKVRLLLAPVRIYRSPKRQGATLAPTRMYRVSATQFVSSHARSTATGSNKIIDHRLLNIAASHILIKAVATMMHWNPRCKSTWGCTNAKTQAWQVLACHCCVRTQLRLRECGLSGKLVFASELAECSVLVSEPAQLRAQACAKLVACKPSKPCTHT